MSCNSYRFFFLYSFCFGLTQGDVHQALISLQRSVRCVLRIMLIFTQKVVKHVSKKWGTFSRVRGKVMKWTFFFRLWSYLCSEQWPDGSSTVSDGETDRFIHAKVSVFVKLRTARIFKSECIFKIVVLIKTYGKVVKSSNLTYAMFYNTGTSIAKLWLFLYFMDCLRIAWYCGKIFSRHLFASGGLWGLLNHDIAKLLKYSQMYL